MKRQPQNRQNIAANVRSRHFSFRHVRESFRRAGIAEIRVRALHCQSVPKLLGSLRCDITWHIVILQAFTTISSSNSQKLRQGTEPIKFTRLATRLVSRLAAILAPAKSLQPDAPLALFETSIEQERCKFGRKQRLERLRYVLCSTRCSSLPCCAIHTSGQYDGSSRDYRRFDTQHPGRHYSNCKDDDSIICCSLWINPT